MEEEKRISEEELKKDVAAAEARIRKTDDFTSPEELYGELIASVKKYHPSDDISLIEKAYRVAADAHKDQKRKSGEPYIIHPLCVAIILADLELDKESIAAGLLHDVVEDTVMTEEELTEEFGPEVSLIVSGVTKLAQLKSEGQECRPVGDAGGESAENVPRYGKGYPCYSGKISGPPAQYADGTVLVTGNTEEKSARDDGYLCSDCTASRYF